MVRDCPVIACTVITKNYLARARALQESLCKHDPGSTLYVLLADRVDGSFNPKEAPFEWIFLEDLPDPSWIRRMSFFYTQLEFCNGVRGYLHEYMLNKTPHEQWLYLDPDVWVLHSLEPILKQLEEAAILLTPHRAGPAASGDVRFLELPVLQTGLYNSGFLGIRRSEESQRFIQWFKDRLILYSFHDKAAGQFVDQTWLNLVPLYFKDVSFLAHPGANLGHWNLFERSFARDGDGALTVDGCPLLFLHFSGWDPSDPKTVSRHARVDAQRITPFWDELSLAYRERLLAQGHEESARQPYAFDRFPDGRPITQRMRRMYYEELLAGTFEGDPFQRGPYLARRDRMQQIKKRIRCFLPGRSP